MPESKTNEIEKISQLRKKITRAQMERRTLEVAPRTHSEAHAQIDAHVAALAEGVSEGHRAPRVVIERVNHRKFIPGFYNLVEFESHEQMAAVVVPDALAKYLHARLDEHLADAPQGVSVSAYVKGIQRLDRQIRSLEIEEETLLCALEIQGVDVHRRADASPEVVLEVEIERDTAA